MSYLYTHTHKYQLKPSCFLLTPQDLYGRKPSLSLGDNLRHLEIFVGEKFCSTMGFEHDNGSKLVDALTSFLERIPNLGSLSVVGNDTPLVRTQMFTFYLFTLLCTPSISKYKITLGMRVWS